MIPVLWKQCNREKDSKIKKKDQKGWRKEKEKRGTCMQVSSQSWPNRMTTRRSSSARIAWSTAHPECRCGNKYDIFFAPPLDPPSPSAASRKQRYRQANKLTIIPFERPKSVIYVSLPPNFWGNMGTFSVGSRGPHTPTPYTTRVGTWVSRIVWITSRPTIPITTKTGTLLGQSSWAPRAYCIHHAGRPAGDGKPGLLE